MDEDHKFSQLVVIDLHVCMLVVDDDGQISKLLWWIKMYDMLTTKMNVRSIMIMMMRVINCVFYMVSIDLRCMQSVERMCVQVVRKQLSFVCYIQINKQNGFPKPCSKTNKDIFQISFYIYVQSNQILKIFPNIHVIFLQSQFLDMEIFPKSNARYVNIYFILD